jgi:NAD(P)-dependent dehydrogenase (short-subunit alcohol dehydrogenase family)
MESHPDGDTRVALITGGSKGLGLALADFLAQQGYELILTARGAGRLEEALADLRSQGGRANGLIGDVSDPAHRRRLTELAGERGRLDLLINNASTLGPLPMPDLSAISLDELRRVFEVNTIGPLALVQGMRPYLAAGQGLVINVSSDAALGGYAGWGGYGASKAALDLITLTLANELREENIHVVSVDPGDMRTDMHRDASPGQDISDLPTPEATLPFWAWLFGQDPAAVSGQRYQAQSEVWTVAA